MSYLNMPSLASSTKKEFAKNSADLFTLLFNGSIKLVECLLMSRLNPYDDLMQASIIIMCCNLSLIIIIIISNWFEIVRVCYLERFTKNYSEKSTGQYRNVQAVNIL